MHRFKRYPDTLYVGTEEWEALYDYASTYPYDGFVQRVDPHPSMRCMGCNVIEVREDSHANFAIVNIV